MNVTGQWNYVSIGPQLERRAIAQANGAYRLPTLMVVELDTELVHLDQKVVDLGRWILLMMTFSRSWVSTSPWTTSRQAQEIGTGVWGLVEQDDKTWIFCSFLIVYW